MVIKINVNLLENLIYTKGILKPCKIKNIEEDKLKIIKDIHDSWFYCFTNHFIFETT